MSAVYKFHRSEALPIVTARIFSKNRSKLVRLVFDTGAATTQIHTPIIDSLGYSPSEGLGLISSYGPAGPIQDGYSLRINKLQVLGKEFPKPVLSVYDFDNFSSSGLHGLLGFDVIRQMNLELRGGSGELIVY